MHIDQRAQRTYIRNNETRSRGNNAASPVYSARSETAGGRGTREDAKKKRKENKKKNAVFPLLERHGCGLITRRWADVTRWQRQGHKAELAAHGETIDESR